MSVHSRQVIFAPRASSDLADIVVAGDEQWGEERALAYWARIDAVITRLGVYPEMGRLRDDVFLGCRVLPVEQHVIYYRPDGALLRVVRILHRRMNPQIHVTGNE